MISCKIYVAHYTEFLILTFLFLINFELITFFHICLSLYLRLLKEGKFQMSSQVPPELFFSS